MVNKKRGKVVAGVSSTQVAPNDCTLTLGQTQAQRDKPFQNRLSMIIQAETKARTEQIARSQDRQARLKPATA
jgi:hypothetical protein